MLPEATAVDDVDALRGGSRRWRARRVSGSRAATSRGRRARSSIDVTVIGARETPKGSDARRRPAGRRRLRQRDARRSGRWPGLAADRQAAGSEVLPEDAGAGGLRRRAIGGRSPAPGFGALLGRTRAATRLHGPERRAGGRRLRRLPRRAAPACASTRRALPIDPGGAAWFSAPGSRPSGRRRWLPATTTSCCCRASAKEAAALSAVDAADPRLAADAASAS